ncbi:putative tRNA-dihydrouridine synthase [Salinivirga cyanobacteriivorans]|uniref:Putative tRNA-dihydrouridine synthase n=1 Tax=Salinivirga cyanobacteriivorans TaxID=1307839 RepID=A0A0S2I034_9BACT|nr:putative tRNA-dihydrouridine synthase [Salinivirga cyanobacteriivorans]
MDCFIHAAPLQGLTDYKFRNVFAQLFSGVDYFYAPYIRLSSKKEIKKANLRDINPKHNVGYTLIPQVLTNNSDDFLKVAKYIEETGYKELNWNLGCPYPMVTKKGMGAGMLNNPDAIVNLLERVCSTTNVQLSVKMRLGNELPGNIL